MAGNGVQYITRNQQNTCKNKPDKDNIKPHDGGHFITLRGARHQSVTELRQEAELVSDGSKVYSSVKLEGSGAAGAEDLRKARGGLPERRGITKIAAVPNQVGGIEKIEDFAKEIEADALAAHQECAAESKVLCKETVVEGTARFGRAVPELD